MAKLSAGTFLMKGTESEGKVTYSQICDITNTPDLGAAPATVDVTTLSDSMHTYIAGLIDTGQFSFSAWLDADTMRLVQEGTSDVEKLCVSFGGEKDEATGKMKPTGTYFNAAFDGQVSAIVAGAEVDNAIPVTLTVTVSSPITYPATISIAQA